MSSPPNDAERRADQASASPPAQGLDKSPAPYTDRQGQYLAFIYYYTKLHGRSPAQADMQRHFGVSPPVVHQTLLTLEQRGFIRRTPGQARALELLLRREELPDLT